MTKALVKLKRDPEAEGRQQDLERFTAFRLEHDLSFDRKHVPAWWDSPQDLEHRYWRAEQKAEAAKAALPPARPRAAPTYITRKQLDSTLESIGRATRMFMDPVIKRLEALEQRPEITFGGPWKDGESYPEKCLVQFQGGLWLSKTPNNSVRPGSEAPAWRQVVKKGAAG